MLPIAEVQRAVYNALTLAVAPVPVLDQAGPNQAFPYCTIGEFLGEPADTLDRQGVDFELTVHVWSRERGMSEIEALMATAKDTLHDARLPITGAQWVTMRWFQAQTLRDIDGRTRHGIMRFRVLTFQV